jgi:hypothetical protein
VIEKEKKGKEEAETPLKPTSNKITEIVNNLFNRKQQQQKNE